MIKKKVFLISCLLGLSLSSAFAGPRQGKHAVGSIRDDGNKPQHFGVLVTSISAVRVLPEDLDRRVAKIQYAHNLGTLNAVCLGTSSVLRCDGPSSGAAVDGGVLLTSSIAGINYLNYEHYSSAALWARGYNALAGTATLRGLDYSDVGDDGDD